MSFVDTMLQVREGEGVVRFTLEKSAGAVGPVSVRVYTVDDTAIGKFNPTSMHKAMYIT